MHMSQDHRQSPLKALLKHLWNALQDTMAARYGSHDTEEVPATQAIALLDIMPPEHPMPEGDNESPNAYCEESDTHCPLAKLIEQF